MQRFLNLNFERFLPPFEIGNVIWFWHNILRTYMCNHAKMRGRSWDKGQRLLIFRG